METIIKLQRMSRGHGGFTYFVYFPAKFTRHMGLEHGEEFQFVLVTKDEMILRRVK